MLSRDYVVMKQKIAKIDGLVHQALVLSESLSINDALLLQKRGELERYKEEYYDRASDKFLSLNSSDPSMNQLITYLAVGLNQKVMIMEKMARKFLADIQAERKNTMSGVLDTVTGWFDDSESTSETDPILNMTSDNDMDRGEIAMQYYYGAASLFPSFKSNYPTIQDLKDHYGAVWDNITDGIGLSWRLTSDRVNEQDVKNSMTALANAGAGRLPANPSSYPQALGKTAMSETAFESLASASLPALESFANIGESVINVGKSGAEAASGLASGLAFITRYKVLLYPAIALGAYLYFFGMPKKISSMARDLRGG